jgi:hypothetical protein
MVFFTCDLGDISNVSELTEIQNVFNSLNNDVKLFLLKNAINQYNNIHNISIQNCESETINKINIEHIKKITELKEDFEDKISTLQFENYYLEKKVKDNQEVKTLNTLIEQLKDDKKQLLEEKILLQKRISQIETNTDDKIQKFIDKMNGSAATKGVIGENIVKNFIARNFGLFDVIDTSSQTGKADLLVTNKNFNLLVENKNIQTFRTDDFVKFYRDVESNVLNKTINAALYISLYDVPFPNGRRGFFFERKYGIPIILISNVYENMYSIYFAINTLLYLIENGFVCKESINDQDDENDDLYLELSDFISNLFSIYDLSMKHVENDRKNILALVDSLQERTENNNTLLSCLKNFTDLYPQFFNNNDKKEDSVQKIVTTLPKNLGINNINYTNLEKYGFKKSDIVPLGGIKVIKNAYKIVNPNTSGFIPFHYRKKI